MGADISIELISIETYGLQFIGHNKIFLGLCSYCPNIYTVPWSLVDHVFEASPTAARSDFEVSPKKVESFR